jgi:hypothetical protein
MAVDVMVDVVVDNVTVINTEREVDTSVDVVITVEVVGWTGYLDEQKLSAGGYLERGSKTA